MSAPILRAIATLGTTMIPAYTGPSNSTVRPPFEQLVEREPHLREEEVGVALPRRQRTRAGRDPGAERPRASRVACSAGNVRSSSIIDRTVSWPVRAPDVGRSP